MQQRTTSLLLGVYGLFSLILTPVTFAAFRDVSADATYGAAIQNLQDKGIIEGYADGSFKPNALVNRAEFLKMVMMASGKDMVIGDQTDVDGCFSDTNGNEWFTAYACAAKQIGIIDGYPDGSFQGNRNVNLAEALKISVRAFDIPEPVYIRAPDHWYDPFMDAASSNTRLFDTVPREPGRVLSRGETAAVVDAFLNAGTAMCGGHKVGESYPSPDGCNSCSCTASGEACTLRACADTKCTSSNSCGAGQYCTTEDGDCQSLCGPGEICPAVCAGVCRVRSSSSAQANACAPKRDAFDAAVAANASCKTNADCTVVAYGCPYLTCGVGINKSGAAAVDASAEAYASCTEDNREPVACAKCAVPSVSCVGGKCVAK